MGFTLEGAKEEQVNRTVQVLSDRAALTSTSMRREASASQTVPSSRNPSPHNHAHLLAQHRGVAFDVTERSSSSSSTSSANLLSFHPDSTNVIDVLY